MGNEAGKEKNGNKKHHHPLPMKNSLYLRLVVGLYLIYIDYSLLNTFQQKEGAELIFFIGAMVIFGLIAAALLVHSGYCLMKGLYRDGSEDTSEEEKNTENP